MSGPTYAISLGTLGSPGNSPGTEALGENRLFPRSTTTSAIFQVTDKPVLLRAFGLPTGAVLSLEMVFGDGTSFQAAPFILAGITYTLTPTNNVLAVSVEGRYRLVLTGAASTAVLVTATQVGLDYENLSMARQGVAAGGIIIGGLTPATLPVAGTDLTVVSQAGSVMRRLPLADLSAFILTSPALTGTPTAPTAAADTNTTQVATTAFIAGQAGAATPTMNGTAAVGTSLRYSRQDHVHPRDTGVVPLTGNSTINGDVTVTGQIAGKVTATGSTTPRSLAARFGEVVVSPRDFGAAMDGTTNDAPAWQAAINYLASIGGGIVQMGAGVSAITSTLSITTKGITLQGVGGDYSHDVGAAGGPSQIKWSGASGGTMVDFSSPVGASNQCMSGGGVINLHLDCAAVAGRGIRVRSWRNITIQCVYVQNATVWAADISVAATLGEARDVQRFLIDRLAIRAFEGAAANGGGLILDGDSGANTSLGYIFQLDVAHINGDGVVFANADNVHTFGLRTARPSGTGRGLVLRGGPDEARSARGNVFYTVSQFGGAGGIHCEGTDLHAYPSTNNVFLYVDTENATAPPVFGPGATGYWSDMRGNQTGFRGISSAFGETVSAVAAAVAGAAGASATFYSGSENNARFLGPNGAWAARVLANGDLDFLRLSGSGRVALDGQRAIPWGAVTWTPTFTASAGSFGSVPVISARYAQFGKTVQGEVVWQIATVGTATGDVLFTLPVNAAGNSVCIGLDGSLGRILIGQTSATQMRLYRESGLSPIAAGNFYRCSFTYEAA